MNIVGILDELLASGQVTSGTGRRILGGIGALGRSPTAGVSSRMPGSQEPACPCCEGKGAFNTWEKPCEIGHMHEKMLCPTCGGSCYFAGADVLTPCPKCAGKGSLDRWDKPCMRFHMHFDKDCPTCHGKAFMMSASGGVPFATAAVGSSRMPGSQEPACPCCEGKGAFNTWEKPCEIGHMHEKMRCPTCDGSCYFAGADALTRCPKCEGKGGLDHWDKPCMRFHMHFDKDCPTCCGKGFLMTAPGSFAAAPAGNLSDLFGMVMGEVQQRTRPGGLDELPQDVSRGQSPERVKACVQALVYAAKCDGRIDRQEQQRILARLGDVSSAEHQFLLDEFHRPLDVDEFARSVPIGMEQQIYALSLTAIELDTAAEANYLRQLARALRLSPGTRDEIHRRLGIAPL